MPDGQVMTLGGDPLFADALDTKTAKFEKRLEIYTPPYLFHGPQPAIAHRPVRSHRGHDDDGDVRRTRRRSPGRGCYGRAPRRTPPTSTSARSRWISSRTAAVSSGSR